MWVGDQALPVEQQGVLVLGAPVGTQAFAEGHGENKLEGERRLLELVAELPDLQCAWNLLLLCCGPRATYHLRTQPPAQVKKYAEGHDHALWDTLCKLLGRGDLKNAGECSAAGLATLALRLGGLGLRSAARLRPAAY